MRIRILLAVALAIFCTNSEAADLEKLKEQFLCVGEQVSGFSYDKNSKQWGSTRFSNTGKFVISKSTGGKAAFEITEVGERYPIGACKEGFSSEGILYCELWLGTFRFNKTNGRFMQTHLFGYIEVGQAQIFSERGDVVIDSNANTPYMQIGKCSPF